MDIADRNSVHHIDGNLDLLEHTDFEEETWDTHKAVELVLTGNDGPHMTGRPRYWHWHTAAVNLGYDRPVKVADRDDASGFENGHL